MTLGGAGCECFDFPAFALQLELQFTLDSDTNFRANDMAGVRRCASARMALLTDSSRLAFFLRHHAQQQM
jgi:hypothetical protein